MRVWDYRPDEVKYLLNPAFCGRVIYGTVSEYQRITKRDFPFPLIYLVLPLVLPRQIRTEINSRTQLTNWVQRHQELIYNFGKRARDLVEITKIPLSQRRKLVGGHEVLRDLYSAFLIRNTEDDYLSPDRDRCIASYDIFLQHQGDEIIRMTREDADISPCFGLKKLRHARTEH